MIGVKISFTKRKVVKDFLLEVFLSKWKYRENIPKFLREEVGGGRLRVEYDMGLVVAWRI